LLLKRGMKWIEFIQVCDKLPCGEYSGLIDFSWCVCDRPLARKAIAFLICYLETDGNRNRIRPGNSSRVNPRVI
jgi:hypothetical protein